MSIPNILIRDIYEGYLTFTGILSCCNDTPELPLITVYKITKLYKEMRNILQDDYNLDLTDTLNKLVALKYKADQIESSLVSAMQSSSNDSPMTIDELELEDDDATWGEHYRRLRAEIPHLSEDKIKELAHLETHNLL